MREEPRRAWIRPPGVVASAGRLAGSMLARRLATPALATTKPLATPAPPTTKPLTIPAPPTTKPLATPAPPTTKPLIRAPRHHQTHGRGSATNRPLATSAVVTTNWRPRA